MGCIFRVGVRHDSNVLMKDQSPGNLPAPGLEFPKMPHPQAAALFSLPCVSLSFLSTERYQAPARCMGVPKAADSPWDPLEMGKASCHCKKERKVVRPQLVLLQPGVGRGHTGVTSAQIAPRNQGRLAVEGERQTKAHGTLSLNWTSDSTVSMAKSFGRAPLLLPKLLPQMSIFLLLPQ